MQLSAKFKRMLGVLKWVVVISIIILITYLNEKYKFFERTDTFTQKVSKDAVIIYTENKPPNLISRHRVYIVKSGDTVWSVADKYNVEWQVIATLNNLDDEFLIKKGQRLVIPNF